MYRKSSWLMWMFLSAVCLAGCSDSDGPAQNKGLVSMGAFQGQEILDSATRYYKDIQLFKAAWDNQGKLAAVLFSSKGANDTPYLLITRYDRETQQWDGPHAITLPRDANDGMITAMEFVIEPSMNRLRGIVVAVSPTPTYGWVYYWQNTCNSPTCDDDYSKVTWQKLNEWGLPFGVHRMEAHFDDNESTFYKLKNAVFGCGTVDYTAGGNIFLYNGNTGDFVEGHDASWNQPAQAVKACFDQKSGELARVAVGLGCSLCPGALMVSSDGLTWSQDPGDGGHDTSWGTGVVSMDVSFDDENCQLLGMFLGFTNNCIEMWEGGKWYAVSDVCNYGKDLHGGFDQDNRPQSCAYISTESPNQFTECKRSADSSFACDAKIFEKYGDQNTISISPFFNSSGMLVSALALQENRILYYHQGQSNISVIEPPETHNSSDKAILSPTLYANWNDDGSLNGFVYLSRDPNNEDFPDSLYYYQAAE